VVGVDFAAEAIRICEERLRREPLEGLSFLLGDAGETGLAGGDWDLIVAADLVEHLYPEDTLRVYEESYRLLRPGGRLLIWTPNPGHLLERLRFSGILRADPTHVDYKTLDRCLAELEGVGFLIRNAEHRPSHLPGVRWVETAAQRFVPLLRRRVLVVAERP
jgi:SAM-dependent methyltransferase